VSDLVRFIDEVGNHGLLRERFSWANLMIRNLTSNMC
jgi:hypothetical protein